MSAGKMQRKSASGKWQRNPATGKIRRNTATVTTCCCNGAPCWKCTTGMPRPPTWRCTLSGFPVCSCGKMGGLFPPQPFGSILSGTVDGIYDLTIDPQGGGCQWTLFHIRTNAILRQWASLTACTGTVVSDTTINDMGIIFSIGFDPFAGNTANLNLQLNVPISPGVGGSVPFACTGATVTFNSVCNCTTCGVGGVAQATFVPVF